MSLHGFWTTTILSDYLRVCVSCLFLSFFSRKASFQGVNYLIGYIKPDTLSLPLKSRRQVSQLLSK